MPVRAEELGLDPVTTFAAHSLADKFLTGSSAL